MQGGRGKKELRRSKTLPIIDVSKVIPVDPPNGKKNKTQGRKYSVPSHIIEKTASELTSASFPPQCASNQTTGNTERKYSYPFFRRHAITINFLDRVLETQFDN
ncbi:hypothetical protein LOTGIDRAFT_167756 [Lottia gigantea]|uniref:Uncharacterized protein n=1 Tax=Lottia gigantea TaxID=225164 RepID=V3Z502_LOTGI|nr:hypothetical protein LOTGIDRAFT_167756 [Lottia gigantea]ESO85783.1 hypothetical protein LOTGIDRAFT_167756 [Lottia gigantea]